MRIRYRHIFAALVVSFLCYSASIYLTPLGVDQSAQLDDQAVEGRLVWQKYNCQSCHQLYGLGGYLGPDLTNVYSAPGKDDKYIKAMVRAGTEQMPSFDLSDEEAENLSAFLRQIDKSGVADPRHFNMRPNGMIEAR